MLSPLDHIKSGGLIETEKEMLCFRCSTDVMGVFFNPFVELFVLVVVLLYERCDIQSNSIMCFKFIDFRATNLSFFKKILFHNNFGKRPLGVRPPYQLCNTTWKNSHVSFSLSPPLTSGTWLFWWNSLCPFLRVCFLCGMFLQRLQIKAMLSPKTPVRAVREPCYSLPLLWSWILFWEGLCVIIPRGQAPALGCDPSLQTEASIPIIKSDLPGRHVEWISLCTAEASITVIPLQSASTLRGRWKKKKAEEREPYSPHVSLQRARGGKLEESVAWADNFYPSPGKEQKIKPSRRPEW